MPFYFVYAIYGQLFIKTLYEFDDNKLGFEKKVWKMYDKKKHCTVNIQNDFQQFNTVSLGLNKVELNKTNNLKKKVQNSFKFCIGSWLFFVKNLELCNLPVGSLEYVLNLIKLRINPSLIEENEILCEIVWTFIEESNIM